MMKCMRWQMHCDVKGLYAIITHASSLQVAVSKLIIALIKVIDMLFCLSDRGRWSFSLSVY
jgi:hypothetical protein